MQMYDNGGDNSRWANVDVDLFDFHEIVETNQLQHARKTWLYLDISGQFMCIFR